MPSKGESLQSLIFIPSRRHVLAALAVCFACVSWCCSQTISTKAYFTSQKPAAKKQSGGKNEPPSFQGPWDSARAQALAMARLKKAQRSDEYNLCYPQSCAMQHRLLKEYRLAQRGSEAVVLLIASTLSERKCRSCAPVLSAFKFEKNNTVWELHDKEIFFTRWGPYVEAADTTVITVSPLADDAYGIFLTSKAVAQGRTVSIMRVYASVQRNPLFGSNLCRVLELQVGEEDPSAKAGPNHWNAMLKPQAGKNRLYDLLITREGIRDGKTFSESEQLKFNGRRYVPYDWNSRPARLFALSRVKLSEGLRRKGQEEEYDAEFPIRPHIIDEYFLAHRNYESMAVLGASSSCGPIGAGCSPFISLFEFQRRDTGWKLVHSEMEFGRLSNYWGRAQSEDFELSLIGDDTFGIFNNGGACNGGTCESSTAIYASARGKLRELVRLDTDGGDFPEGPPGGLFWDFQIRLNPTATGFYDLAVSGLGERVGDSGTFRFNGVKYISKTWHHDPE